MKLAVQRLWRFMTHPGMFNRLDCFMYGMFLGSMLMLIAVAVGFSAIAWAGDLCK